VQRDAVHPYPDQERPSGPHPDDTWTQPYQGDQPASAAPQPHPDSGRQDSGSAAGQVPSRGLFEPRIPPAPSDDDSQQWHSPGEQR
jgi:hypothetical protein